MIYKNHLIIEISSYTGKDTSIDLNICEDPEEDGINWTETETLYMITDLNGEAPDYGYRTIEEAKQTIDATQTAKQQEEGEDQTPAKEETVFAIYGEYNRTGWGEIYNRYSTVDTWKKAEEKAKYLIEKKNATNVEIYEEKITRQRVSKKNLERILKP
jgi:hypothetical protein